MGEEAKYGVISKLIDKAGESVFFYIVMGVVCWIMYSMIVQNNKNTQLQLEDIKNKYEDCNSYRVELLEKLLEKSNKND